MKYIRLFEQFEEDLEDFCNNSLAYLLDDGFDLFIVDRAIYLSKPVLTDNRDYGDDNKAFKWDYVKDDFIPFIELLSIKCNYKKYEKHNNNIEFFTNDSNASYKYYCIQDLLDDKPSNFDYYLIYQIRVST